MRRRLLQCAAALVTLVATSAPTSRQSVEPYLANAPGAGIIVATVRGSATGIKTYGVPFDQNASFEIGSITKTFTAVLLGDMIARGEVRASDPIEKFLPAGVVAPTFEGKHVTLIDLATQRSGLPALPTNLAPADVAQPYVDYNEPKLFAFLSTYRLTRAPGSKFEYSNLGFGLLGYLLARRLGEDYPTAIRTRVLEPLGMTHTAFSMANLSPPATVGGHDADGDSAQGWLFGVLAGAGAMVSTPADLLRYARANLSPRGPLAAVLRDTRAVRRAADGGGRIGFAWLTAPDGIVWHNGATAGFRSFIGLDEVHRRAVIVLANGFLPAVDAIGFHTLDPKFPLPSPTAPDVPVASALLAGYVGTYTFRNGSTGTVTHDARGLIVNFDRPAFRARLHPRSSRDFSIILGHLDVRFAGIGAALMMTVSAPGQPPETGKREQ